MELIIKLPNEMLLEILKYCNFKEICNLFNISRSFRQKMQQLSKINEEYALFKTRMKDYYPQSWNFSLNDKNRWNSFHKMIAYFGYFDHIKYFIEKNKNFDSNLKFHWIVGTIENNQNIKDLIKIIYNNEKNISDEFIKYFILSSMNNNKSSILWNSIIKSGNVKFLYIIGYNELSSLEKIYIIKDFIEYNHWESFLECGQKLLDENKNDSDILNLFHDIIIDEMYKLRTSSICTIETMILQREHPFWGKRY